MKLTTEQHCDLVSECVSALGEGVFYDKLGSDGVLFTSPVCTVAGRSGCCVTTFTWTTPFIEVSANMVIDHKEFNGKRSLVGVVDSHMNEAAEAMSRDLMKA